MPRGSERGGLKERAPMREDVGTGMSVKGKKRRLGTVVLAERGVITLAAAVGGPGVGEKNMAGECEPGCGVRGTGGGGRGTRGGCEAMLLRETCHCAHRGEGEFRVMCVFKKEKYPFRENKFVMYVCLCFFVYILSNRHPPMSTTAVPPREEV